jgi:hypothetical protein
MEKLQSSNDIESLLGVVVSSLLTNGFWQLHDSWSHSGEERE